MLNAVGVDVKWTSTFLNMIVVAVFVPLFKTTETQLEVNMKLNKMVVQVAVFMGL